MSCVLALDTTAAHCAVALVSGNKVLASRTVPMTKGQAERLFPIIDEILGETAFKYSDLDAIAVATGPGNFTGVRICVAAARGLSLSLEIPAIGVSVLEALAFGHSGNVIATVDARGGQVYNQVFCDGVAQRAPLHLTLEEIRCDLESLKCVGYMADDLAQLLDAVSVGDATPQPQVYGFIAQTRDWQGEDRPVPLYIREADAALPSEAPPVIIP